MADEDRRACYGRGDREHLHAEPHRAICYCGVEVELDEHGVWQHVRRVTP